MATSTLMFLALSMQASALDLATCQGKSLWLTIPVEKSAIELWLNQILQPADREQIVLDDAPGYKSTTQHPLQIELDSFHSCKTLGGIPYPSFNEVAAMIPYVRWQNKTRVHFQPWSMVSNIFGASAMMLLGSRHVTEEQGKARYPTPPSTWEQSMVKLDGCDNDNSLCGTVNVSASVDVLVNSTLLESTDTAWRDMVNLKRTKSVAYDECATSGFAWKFSCNRIQWDIQKAAKVTDGQIWIDSVGSNGRSSMLFPFWFIQDSIPALRKRRPGLEVYAAETIMTTTLGCPSEPSETEVIV